ncbi:hypothetical protein CDD81_7336 [Ophiocordyceps australis]|uniref:Vacuolar protein sorting-associated protein 62 n=1 Tax=Ophiocordyceps australis TaxID=1399860 RepID=A0A2C5X908_9HYPO|nr:hypothetical protein CDD81_7336 [Ophiocordyceps australis]
MTWLTRCSLALGLLGLFSLVALVLPSLLDPTAASPEKRLRDRLWINSSPYVVDRQLCRWLGLCGLQHLRQDPAALSENGGDGGDDSGGGNGAIADEVWGELRRRALKHPEPRASKQQRRRILKDVPDYVVKHAPLVHLYSGEEFWPSDIQEHLQHMEVQIDNAVYNDSTAWSLDNLAQLNRRRGSLSLHSRDDVESRPAWLHSRQNTPSDFPSHAGGHAHAPKLGSADDAPAGGEPTTWFDVDKHHRLHRIVPPRSARKKPPGPAPGQPRVFGRGHKPDAAGYSRAPAVLVLVDKGSGIVDAFWFFFYSYNLGQTVLGIRFGNHVGDWEHCMMRFEHGVPRGIYFSEHEGGQAYAWEAVEKRGQRPVIYSALGSHAMYALPGNHAYILPFGLLKDVTDKGPLWDPALNNYAYHYDATRDHDAPQSHDINTDPLQGHDKHDWQRAEQHSHSHSLTPAAKNPNAPTSWFHYRGHWGDELYLLADPRQWRLFGQYHYVTGPTGPKFKQLARSKLCRGTRCRILHRLDPNGKWYS